MATRPVYCIAHESDELVKINYFDFKWHPGLAVTQKQKSIEELHNTASDKLKNNKILEISSKSRHAIGVSLSAFNLTIKIEKYKKISVVTAFQSSKVFEMGGPYVDLLYKNSIDAKKDLRIKNSGELLYFSFFQDKWELTPKTAFYDWLYINAVHQHASLAKKILDYDCFTDIEFNPEKSINCQANAAALFVSLHRRGLLSHVLKSKENYLSILAKYKPGEISDMLPNKIIYVQGTLF